MSYQFRLSLSNTHAIEQERRELVRFVVGRLIPRLPWLARVHHFRSWFFEPMNYWRQIEMPLVLSLLRQQGIRGRILDIGSPKLLALYLASTCNVESHATDISDYFVADLRRFRQVLRLPNLEIHTADGRQTGYPDAFFDAVFSISVIEHMPDDSDMQCFSEVSRLLKPGGVFVFDLPVFVPAEDTPIVVEERFADGRFHQHRYSLAALGQRLATQPKLELMATYLAGEHPTSTVPTSQQEGALWPENYNLIAADPIHRRLRWLTKHALIPLSHYAMSSRLRRKYLYHTDDPNDPQVLNATFIMRRI